MTRIERSPRKELEIARESFASSASWEVVSKYIHFPTDVNGLTIVDLGAGASPAVLELQRRGAEAVAIDYRYGDLKDLKHSVDSYLTSLSNQGNAAYIRTSRRARDLFFNNVGTPRLQMVAGLSGSLPLTDGSVDFAYSLQGMSKFLTSDCDTFLAALEEAMRILKPGDAIRHGGELQMQPWAGGIFNQSQELNKIANETYSYLRCRGIPYRVEMPSIPLASPRIRIIKP